MSGEDFELSQELTIGSVDGGTLPAMPPEPKSLSNWDFDGDGSLSKDVLIFKVLSLYTKNIKRGLQ